MARIHKNMIKMVNPYNLKRNCLFMNTLTIPERDLSKDWRIGKNKFEEYYYYIDINDKRASSSGKYQYRYDMYTNSAMLKDYVVKANKMFDSIAEIVPHDGFFRVILFPYKRPFTSIFINVSVEEKQGLECLNKASDFKGLSDFMSNSDDTKTSTVSTANNIIEKKDVIITIPELNPLFGGAESEWCRDVAADNPKYYIDIKNDDIHECFSYQASIHSDEEDMDEDKIRSFNSIESISSYDGYARIALSEGIQCIDSVDIELKCL